MARLRLSDRIKRPARLLRSLLSRLLRQTKAARQRHFDQIAESDDLHSATIQETGGLPLPPAKLQRRIINRYFDRFVKDGEDTVNELDRILRRAGRPLGSFESILDFGVGCARVARPLRAYVGPAPRLFGTDIDAEAVEWCRRNYASLAVFEVNEPSPPLNHANDSFDLIYCLSVFTHLPEDMQFEWLAELNRVLKPSGHLIASTHGEGYYDRITVAHRRELEAHGFLYFNNGLTEGLPEFYQTTFHTHDYIRNRWSDYLEIVDLESRGILRRQDAVLCRKKGEARFQ